MTRRRAIVPALVASLLLLAATAPAAPAPAGGDAAFLRLGDAFIDHLLRTRPHVATRLGVHDSDDRLLPVTEASLAEDAVWFRDFRSRLEALPRASLSFERALDDDLLRARVDRELLDLEVVQPYRRNPNAYLELVAGSIQSLLQRNFASPCTRLRAAARRLEQVPEVLRAARINLDRPPRVATEVAISQFRGVLQLYREELPAAAAACRDPQLQAELVEADSLAAGAVEEFVHFLSDELLPRSDGDFALGRDVYQRKLACDEMETAPVESLLARGGRELEATRARMESLAARIAPGGGVAAALESLEVEPPSAHGLVASVAGQLDSIRAFLRAKNLITLPAREDLRVRETPVFARSLSFASMDSPGIWERSASEAYYNVTPPDSTWSAEERRNHLAFFNRYASGVISIHEALPGHYYQFLALRRAPSRLRQILRSGANSEGWAHYCEQMAIEEGWGRGDPRVEMAQLQLALQRIGRLIVGISLHTQGMSYDEAVKLFVERCWMKPVTAAREARRGTMDPTYLVYTLGKWRILDLREEVRRRLGARFDLREFHDAFLRQGAPALPVARAALLHDLDALAGDEAR